MTIDQKIKKFPEIEFFGFEDYKGNKIEYETTKDIIYRITTKEIKIERPLDKKNAPTISIEVSAGIELIPLGEDGKPLIEVNGNGIKQTKKGYVICGNISPVPAYMTFGRERRYI